MSRPQLALVLHALVLILSMAFIVPALTRALGGPQGYLAALCIYWLGFCLPVIALHVQRQRSSRLFSERLAWRDWFVPFLLLVQVSVVGLVVIMPNTTLLTTHGAMAGALVALINGPLEEAAWRGGFLTRFAERRRLGFWLGWLLFSAWHIPLMLSHGVVLDGLVLVGGATALGLFWSWITWRTGSVFWTTIAHVLTNVMSFWVFFNSNGL
jgi:membrane protease YdiL (CAAX protease family)